MAVGDSSDPKAYHLLISAGLWSAFQQRRRQDRRKPTAEGLREWLDDQGVESRFWARGNGRKPSAVFTCPASWYLGSLHGI